MVDKSKKIGREATTLLKPCSVWISNYVTDYPDLTFPVCRGGVF